MSSNADIIGTVIATLQRGRASRRSMEITPATTLKESLGVTSLELVALLTSTCTRHRVDLMTLSDVDLARMKTVGDVATILSSKASA